MEKTLKKDVDFKKTSNKVALVKHIYENFGSYIESGSITTQDYLKNPDFEPSDYSGNKTLPQPKVVTSYSQADNGFWIELLRHSDIIAKRYNNSDNDEEYIYKVGEVSRWRRTAHEFTMPKNHGDHLIEMIKFQLADQLAMNMYKSWEGYDKYLKVKKFIQQYKETPIVEKRRDYYNDEYNGVLGKEVTFDDDVWSDTRDIHSITLSFGVSSYGYEEGKLLEVTFNFRDKHEGLLYKKEGSAKLHYHVEGSKYDENKSVSLLTGELKTKWSGNERKVMNYKLTNRWGETRRDVNFTTYILEHRQWVDRKTRQIQEEDRKKVFVRDSINKLQEKFPNCKVYTTDKTTTTYGSNGNCVKRYGDCNIIVKYPNGSKIIYDLYQASKGSLKFTGAYDSEYVKTEYNEEHFIKFFQKQNDDS